MTLKIVVLAKQVPDTRNVGKDAMTAEGTVNRAALPAIFNPDDLNALEQALRLKEQHPGSTVAILTMGPPRAGEIIRQGLYRGADTGYLLTDRLFDKKKLVCFLSDDGMFVQPSSHVPDRFIDHIVPVVSGQNDHSGFTIVKGADRFCEGDTVHAGHLIVGEDDLIGASFLAFFNDLS